MGARLVLWDGEGAGEGAKGWGDCDKKGACRVTYEALPGVGKEGSTGLKFHGDGPGFLGMGWNWFGWWPETAGTDIGPYTHLTFFVRLESKSPELAPEPSAVAVALGCSKGKKSSASAQVHKYEKDFADGKWHKITVPLVDLMKGEGKDFDPHSAWEFRISAWAATPKDFDLVVDEIAVEKP